MDTVKQGTNFFQAKNAEKFRIILLQLEKRFPRKSIAAGLGIPYKTFCHYLTGKQHFPPDLIPRLYEITQDRTVLECFLEPLGLMAIPKICKSNNGCKTIEKLELQLSICDGKAIEEIEKALEDKVITPSEFKRIHSKINEARRVLAELDLRLLQKVKPKNLN